MASLSHDARIGSHRSCRDPENRCRHPQRVSCPGTETLSHTPSLPDDGEKLFRDFGMRARGLMDDTFRAVYNREIVSLAGVSPGTSAGRFSRVKYARRTGRPTSESRTIWLIVRPPCHPIYDVIDRRHSSFLWPDAANDCHCALMVNVRFQDIAAGAGKTLDVLSTHSRHVGPRSLKLGNISLPTLPQRLDASTRPPVSDYCIPEPPRAQQFRAYKLWHVEKLPLEQMCMTLRTGVRVESFKEGTVI